MGLAVLSKVKSKQQQTIAMWRGRIYVGFDWVNFGFTSLSMVGRCKGTRLTFLLLLCAIFEQGIVKKLKNATPALSATNREVNKFHRNYFFIEFSNVYGNFYVGLCRNHNEYCQMLLKYKKQFAFWIILYFSSL